MRGHCGRTRPPGWPHRRRGPSPHLAAVGFALDGGPRNWRRRSGGPAASARPSAAPGTWARSRCRPGPRPAPWPAFRPTPGPRSVPGAGPSGPRGSSAGPRSGRSGPAGDRENHHTARGTHRTARLLPLRSRTPERAQTPVSSQAGATQPNSNRPCARTAAGLPAAERPAPAAERRARQVRVRAAGVVLLAPHGPQGTGRFPTTSEPPSRTT